MLYVERISPLTGKTTAMVLDINQEQVDEWNNPNRTKLIQDIFPNLTDDEREFVMTGYTPEDWEKLGILATHRDKMETQCAG